MAFQIDESTDFGARVARRLREEDVVWLTTVTPAGTPQPTFIWFWWNGADRALLQSQPGVAKLRNLTSNPRLALNFNGTATGGDMIVITGTADLSGQPAEADVQAYKEKYARQIADLDYDSPEAFFDDYSVPIQVTFTHLRGF